MMNAYDEEYLDDAMKNLGEAFDYAVNVCHLTADEFLDLFIAEGYADKFGRGIPKIVGGISGTELVMEVLIRAGLRKEFPPAQVSYDYSPQYWAGWILAYFQWKSGRTFRDIKENISMEEIINMYHPFHEAAEDKFVDAINSIIKTRNTKSKLQRQRQICGYSQSELSRKSNVNLRTLQQYELKTKNINKASVETVLDLSNALGCRIEDLIEYNVDK